MTTKTRMGIQKRERQFMANELLTNCHFITRSGLMIQISTKSSVVTLINVFTVDPTHQQRPVKLITRATEASVRHAPGLVSATLPRSLAATKVTMYAQWQSVQDYQAMPPDPTPLTFFQAA